MQDNKVAPIPNFIEIYRQLPAGVAILRLSLSLRGTKKTDSEFVKDNWMNKQFILSVLSNFFDSKNAESVFAPLLRDGKKLITKSCAL